MNSARRLTSIKMLVLAIGLSLTPSFSWAQSFDLSSIPDGLPSARENSAPGVLGTAYASPTAVIFKEQLDVLESKSYGLSHLSTEPVAIQAETVFYLETLAAEVIKSIVNSPELNDREFEKKSLLYRAEYIYSDIRYHGERLFEIMIREIDRAKPGTSGIQLITDKNGEILYAPNYRYEVQLTPEQMKVEYAKKLADFEAKGGKLSEIFDLSLEAIRKIPGSEVHVEFVEMPNGKIRATTGSAGHILMAQGQKTHSAGVMVFLKDHENNIAMILVSNSSGSYKPDLSAVAALTDNLTMKFKVQAENILITKGEPLSPQIVKIMLKAENKPDEFIKAKIAKIKATAKSIGDDPAAVFAQTLSAFGGSCKNILVLSL